MWMAELPEERPGQLSSGIMFVFHLNIYYSLSPVGETELGQELMWAEGMLSHSVTFVLT